MIEIHWTCGSIDEARSLSRYLVQEGFVASAQIIPWIESIYTWNGDLHTSQETKVIFKTENELFQDVKDIILKNCKYEVPEIIAVEIHAANPAYQEWLQNAVKTHIR